MSSTFPTQSLDAHVGLRLIGRDTERDTDKRVSDTSKEESSPSKPVTTNRPNAPKSQLPEDSTCTPAGRSQFTPHSPRRHSQKPDSSSSKRASHQDPENSRCQSEPGPTIERPVVRHRIAEVRIRQGVTERTMAKRLGIDIRSYRTLECATTDLTLSQLVAIQLALEVPLIELLEDTESLSRPVEERAKLVRTMKTAVAIREAKPGNRIKRLAEMLCSQLCELMPELEDVSGWPQFGARRGESAIGRALAEPINTRDLNAE
ncbi:MAG TPA: hypothetical protein DDW52_15860 [Planctomycetaceae bacterium]|nr:hypothetical protein [Planctomycetaceae bacterium]